jgi:hypothetical protein
MTFTGIDGGDRSVLAGATRTLELAVPVWGGALLAGAGLVYLAAGGLWPLVFDVLSLTVLGCGVGLVVAAWVPMAPWAVLVAGGLAFGVVGAFARRAAHIVLTAGVLATIFATLAALAVGPEGFVAYVVEPVGGEGYATEIGAPSWRSDPVLAAGLAGLLVGAALASLKFDWSERVVTAAQGAALVELGAVELAGHALADGPAIAERFPMTLAASWAVLLALGLVVQTGLAARRRARAEGAAAEAAAAET